MKGWIWCLILLSLGGKLIGQFLPRGERSPLFSPLRLLLSLSLILVLFSPWIRLLSSDQDLSHALDSFFCEQEQIDSDKLILEQMGKTMKKSVDTAFPDTEYSLEIYTDETNVPILVKVTGLDVTQGQKIADFIQLNYGLEASAD